MSLLKQVNRNEKIKNVKATSNFRSANLSSKIIPVNNKINDFVCQEKSINTRKPRYLKQGNYYFPETFNRPSNSNMAMNIKKDTNPNGRKNSINVALIKYRGDAFKLLRQKSSFTIQQLAEKSELSKTFISEIENGLKTPSDASLQKLASALNVPMNYFDIQAMILGKHLLSPQMQETVEKLVPLIQELTNNFQNSEI